MKTTALVLALGSASLVASLPAAAGNRHSAGARDYAQVIDTRPIYRTVRIAEPRQECREERVVYRDGRHRSDSTAATLAGAVAGGVIGHQFGKGSGRDAATVFGALLGASVGQQAAAQSRPVREQVHYETRCHTVDHYRIEDRIEGYDVTYRYQGRTYQTRMPYDPGSRIPINVRVEPALRY